MIDFWMGAAIWLLLGWLCVELINQVREDDSRPHLSRALVVLTLLAWPPLAVIGIVLAVLEQLGLLERLGAWLRRLVDRWL